MSRYIDAQKLLDWIKDSITMYGNTYNADQLNMWGLFEEQVKNTPTADVEPVIRCKDCINREFCEVPYVHDFSENDYCSSAEEKEDKEE